MVKEGAGSNRQVALIKKVKNPVYLFHIPFCTIFLCIIFLRIIRMFSGVIIGTKKRNKSCVTVLHKNRKEFSLMEYYIAILGIVNTMVKI